MDIPSDDESHSEFDPNEEDDQDTPRAPSNDPWMDPNESSEDLQPKVISFEIP